MNSEINLKFEIDKTTARILLIAAAVVVILLITSSNLGAQEVADTIRVNTRVVFMDALVKDKRTGVPISDLTPENFEVFDDGNARPVSYFTREGQARKPLALVLILDLRESGAGRYLKRPEVLKVVADELARLSPLDEVAILAIDLRGEDQKRVWLSGFTRDSAQLVAALARAPQFIGGDDEGGDERDQKTSQKSDAGEGQGGSPTPGSDKDANKTDNLSASETDPPPPGSGPGPGRPRSEEPVNVEITKGKNGTTVTRTTRADGSVDVKRTNKKGEVTMEIGGIYDLAAAVKDTTLKAKQDRPNSQLAVIWVSDGIAPILFEDRDATEQMLIRSNVIFNSMTAEMRTLFKLLMPIAKPVGGMLGMSIYGTAKRLAQQTGGEAVKISRVKDFSTGLSKIIGNLTARYSLGFTLAEDEKDDGHLHNLDVKVKAKDAKGKVRKLEVSARKGYYMSETGANKASTAAAIPQ